MRIQWLNRLLTDDYFSGIQTLKVTINSQTRGSNFASKRTASQWATRTQGNNSAGNALFMLTNQPSQQSNARYISDTFYQLNMIPRNNWYTGNISHEWRVVLTNRKTWVITRIKTAGHIPNVNSKCKCEVLSQFHDNFKLDRGFALNKGNVTVDGKYELAIRAATAAGEQESIKRNSHQRDLLSAVAAVFFFIRRLRRIRRKDLPSTDIQQRLKTQLPARRLTDSTRPTDGSGHRLLADQHSATVWFTPSTPGPAQPQYLPVRAALLPPTFRQKTRIRFP